MVYMQGAEGGEEQNEPDGNIADWQSCARFAETATRADTAWTLPGIVSMVIGIPDVCGIGGSYGRDAIII